ncbi:hypothetical protein BJX99DRAFT_253984 [Aspergillus californicus]
MTDPFSVSAGVVGVVSLGLTVTKGLVSYYGPWKDYDSEIRDLTTKLEGLGNILRPLEGFVSVEHELVLPSDQYKSIVTPHLIACREASTRLERILEKCKSTDISPFLKKHDWLRLKKAVYPFKKDTLMGLCQTVSGLQDNLSLALHLLNGALIAQQQKQIQTLLSKTSSIDVRTAQILDVVEQDSGTLVSSRPTQQQGSLITRCGVRMMPDPLTLQHLCNRQQHVAWIIRPNLFRTPDADCLTAMRQFVCELIDVGVPVHEQSVNKQTVLDAFIEDISFNRVSSSDDIARIGLDILQDLLVSGSTLTQFYSSGMAFYMPSYRYPYKCHIGDTVHAFITRNHVQDFALSRFEIAVATRSEEGLDRFFSQGEHYSVRGPLFMALGWPRGLSMILESSLPRDQSVIDSCFRWACLSCNFRSALVVLHYLQINPSHVYDAILCRDIHLLEATISKLALARCELYTLALEHLPQAVIYSLSLPTIGLLDGHAVLVFEALETHGVEMVKALNFSSLGFPGYSSVYSAIYCNMDAAKLLYENGFTDLNQNSQSGFTPLMEIERGRASWDQYSSPFADFQKFGIWMVSKGANVHHRSISGLPAVFNISRQFGMILYYCFYDDRDQGDDSWTTIVASIISSQRPSDKWSLSMILSNNVRDNCQCGCSAGGCSMLNQMFRTLCEKYENPLTIYTPQMVGDLISRLGKTCEEEYENRSAFSTIRYVTFEALGMTHTCHVYGSHEIKIMDPEDVKEIRDEESGLLNELEGLLVEFEQKYGELGVGITEFLTGYWQTRMDEVLTPGDMGAQEVRQITEIGVILEV